MGIDQALSVLENNWNQEGYTVPSNELYPYQWNWDSGFIAIGMASFRPEKALKEIESLVEAQWENGMIPQIVFWGNTDGYFPGPDEWGMEDREIKTSGITQPPVIVHAVSELFEYIDESKALELASAMESYLEWWVKERSYDGKIVYVRHPWETGMDDSPAWISVMAEIEPENPEYSREDLKTDQLQDERPEKWDYDRYVYLVIQGRNLGWQENKLKRQCPFQVADILTNSIFVRACEELATIYEKLDDNKKAKKWNRQASSTSEKIREKLWCDELKNFVSYDIKNDQKLRKNTIAGFTAFYADIPNSEQKAGMIENLDNNFMDFNYGCATYSGKGLDLDRYWRGPVWISTNWLLSEGLRRVGEKERANNIVNQSIELMDEHGFREYFNPKTGEPRGAKCFSWSASLYLYWKNQNF